MNDLFGRLSSGIRLDMPDAEVIYFPHFFDCLDSDAFFASLYHDVVWQHDAITVFGKTHMQPRLTAFYAQNDKPYRYSGIRMMPHEFNEPLSQIKCKVEELAETSFTCCLLNLYRNGQDSMGWHADDEPELGSNPIIASVSFGASRSFHFRHRHHPALKQKLLLEHGSVLLMRGATQHHWQHHIPKTRNKIDARINLTFRVIV